MKKGRKRKDVPFRVAPRLEGKVRNVGIKPKKKQKNMRKKDASSGTVSR